MADAHVAPLKVHLNIGCGHRPFPHEQGVRWINMDVADAEEIGIPGHIEYVKGDASKPLPFSTEQFDVIFSSHVIEHFWPWDVHNVVREWSRCLRVGGSLVLECPNLLACLAMVTMAEFSGDPKMRWFGMNGIYGNPSEKSIEMKHKWGWTPETLCTLLTECGLHDAVQVPAEFKQKNRDMRVVAVKR